MIKIDVDEVDWWFPIPRLRFLAALIRVHLLYAFLDNKWHWIDPEFDKYAQFCLSGQPKAWLENPVGAGIHETRSWMLQWRALSCNYSRLQKLHRAHRYSEIFLKFNGYNFRPSFNHVNLGQFLKDVVQLWIIFL